MDALKLLSPQASGIIYASAGTGKTWLLISRLLRLLLADKRPDSILAITFTNKAADEMRERLAERVLEWHTASDEVLEESLHAIGIDDAAPYYQKARDLYEAMLYSTQPIQITTFHAFCQRIIALCPLQSGTPLTIAIAEHTNELQEAAVDQLFKTASQCDEKITEALDVLFEQANSLDSVRTILKAFFQRQNDWYSYISQQSNGAQYATQRLHQQLSFDEALSRDEIWKRLRDSVKTYCELISLHKTKINTECADKLSQIVLMNTLTDKAWQQLNRCIHTNDGKIRQRTLPRVLERKLGKNGSRRLLSLASDISEEIKQFEENLKRKNNYQLNKAWYIAGTKLLEIYTAIKKQRNMLDFNDLERVASKLLGGEVYGSEWLQYRLATRIEHILIDEFQDTNPTQWQLLEPLMAEIAAQEGGSVFIVGDRKQSIYSFRRAEPDLQLKAGDWIKKNLSGSATTINTSYRSAPEIIDFVNQIFSDKAIQLTDFETHQTNKKTTGGVHLFDLFTPPEKTAPEEWRNPLLQPYKENETASRSAEATEIAEAISQLLQNNLQIADGNQQRPVQYRDILILARQKTHFDVFARMLRQHDIPVISARDVGLFTNLAVKDMLQLLAVLINPYNNLALAQVLSSPIFSLNEAQLIELSEVKAESWFDKLKQLDHQATELWQGIYQTLKHWIEKSDSIPIHDLFSQIFIQQNIIRRYRASVHPQESNQVQANLEDFLEYTLDYDSGRYPNLAHFLARAEILQRTEDQQEIAPRQQDCVRMMSIHGAKGLEAPIVFLVDCAALLPNKTTHEALVDWPIDAPRPKHFILLPPIKERSDLLERLTKERQQHQQKEEINLIYVALTRAKQYLFISGSGKEDSTREHWYELIKQQCLKPPQIDALQAKTTRNKHKLSEPTEKNLTELFEACPKLPTALQQLSPSSLVTIHHPEEIDKSTFLTEALIRGTVVHSALELLNSQLFDDFDKFKQTLAVNLPDESLQSNYLLQSCAEEAWQLIHKPELKTLFDDSYYLHTFNEMPILYENSEKQIVYGKMDRVCVADDSVWIVDYKSNRITSQQPTQSDYQKLASYYAEQMRCYQTGIGRLFPQKKIRTSLLFTQHGFLYDYPAQLT